MYLALRAGACAHFFRQLDENVRPRIVDDRVHRVEAQPVEMKFLEPVERVVDEEIAHRTRVWTVEIDRGAPVGMMPLGEERAGISVEVVAFRAEVVVNDVEQNHEPALMGGCDETFQVLGSAI